MSSLIFTNDPVILATPCKNKLFIIRHEFLKHTFVYLKKKVIPFYTEQRVELDSLSTLVMI